MIEDNEYSQETISLLGKVPNRFVRYGLLVFFVIIISLFLGLYFISYPDTYHIDIEIKKDTNQTNPIYYGLAQIDSDNIWKINNGEIVDISLYKYPHKKYGVLIGRISTLSKDNNKNIYNIHIALDNGLITNFNNNLEFIPNFMDGQLKIKGKEKSFFNRIFSSSIEN